MSDARGIVVTGAAGEIGTACCRQLLTAGHRVVAVDIDEAAGKALLELLDGGDRITFISANVADEDAVAGYVAEATARLGRIDGFFNNAGIEGTVAPIPAYPTDVFDRVVAVNLRGVFLGLKHVMGAMAADGGGGAIVNTASVAGLIGNPGISAYIATKHAVVGLTKVAALEGASLGIRVNAVCPGPIESRMMGSLEDGAMSLLGLPDQATAKAGFTQLIPGARYGTAAEVADAVEYLLSPKSSYISGASIPIDFGLTAQ
jgi:NAD(P)-dependent dehydrogenase (short-subunit alcohol dehydrogenase family)